MIAEHTRNAVWDQYLDAARLVRYYAALTSAYQRRHAILQYLILASAAGGITALVDLFPPIVQVVSGASVALFVIVDFVGAYARKAAVLQVITMECGRLETDLESLWLEVQSGSIDDYEARRENTRLAQRMNEVTGWAGQAHVQENQALNQSCTEDAYKVMADRYAVQG